ncbi:MAG: hypothetical protein QM759_09335 [Terricaulis sp.]
MKKFIRRAVLATALFAATAGVAMADNNNREVTIVNATGVTMNNFYSSNSATTNWGPDQLGANETLAAGSSKAWNFDDGSGACLFDFKAVFIDSAGHQHNAVRNRINVCQVSTFTFSSID